MLRRAHQAQLSIVETDLAVRLGRRLGVVRGHHDGGAALGLRPQQRQHAFAVVVVELGGRLVGEQHPGGEGQPAGDRDPLLLAAGELLDQVAPDSSRPTRASAARARSPASPASTPAATSAITMFSCAERMVARPFALWDEGRIAGGAGVSAAHLQAIDPHAPLGQRHRAGDGPQQ